jgi:hypothetical protein
MKMETQYYRKTAVIVGALFIIATVTAISSMVLLGTSFDEQDYLVDVPETETEIVVAVLFELVLAISVIGIGALMFPILKRQVEGLAAGYVVFRLVEGILIVVATTTMLVMLTLGRDYASGALDAATLEPMGALLMALREWSFIIGTLIFLGLGGLVLNYLLYRSALVPRWLSVWGLIGGAGVLVYGIFHFFDLGSDVMLALNLLAAPVAVQEMVFAPYLIIKGFNAPAPVPGSPTVGTYD